MKKCLSLFIVIFIIFLTTTLWAQNPILPVTLSIESITLVPKSPPVLLNYYKANTAENSSQAIRLTTKFSEIYPIIKIPLSASAVSGSNVTNYNYLCCFIKTDTGCGVELALEDEKIFSPFENISFYLSKKVITSGWQKLEYPLQNVAVDKTNLKNLYLRIIGKPENVKEILYLDKLYFLSKREKQTGQKELIIYNFDQGLKNQYEATPSAAALPPTSIDLTLSSRGHRGVTGNSLQATYQQLPPGYGTIYLPILKGFRPFSAQEYSNIALKLKTERNYDYTATILYKKDFARQNSYQPYYTQQIKIHLPDRQWHELEFALDPKQKNELVGLKIDLPENSGGILYLNDLRLME